MPLLFILISVFFIPCTAGSSDNSYLNELIESATALNLRNDRYWQVLMHYKTGLKGTESLIDDPRFFLSPDGKKDPEAELNATIASFFDEFLTEETHSRCQFPARYEWLKKKLAIDESRLPLSTCSELEDITVKVNPKAAVLVFPAAYMNSPASMFGHTLIRLDSDLKSKLLSYSISYAATTNETSGLAFAYKGIFGYYHGNYSILPYYDKVKEYNNMDQRDIWEYELNLTEEEVGRMFLHVWELRNIYSHYYFFDENCAYQLLFLIEAARPSLNLTDSFFYWILPVDTIKAASGNDLIKSTQYRPSISTRIKEMLKNLDPGTQGISLGRAKDESSAQEILDAGIEKGKKILALDLATEIIQYNFSRGELTKEDYKKRLITNLTARSSLGITTDKKDAFPAPPAPQTGHHSGRAGVGLGQREGRAFSEITFRPAYQTLIEPDKGYIKGSQVVFLDLTVRYYEETGVKLERLDVIDLFSISPRNRFFKHLSWKVGTGIRSKTLSDLNRHHTYYLNPGFGYAYENDLLGLYYILIESDLDAGSGLNKDYALGLGVSAGFIKNLTDSWKMHAFVKTATYELGDEHREDSLTLSQNFRLNHDNNISLHVTGERAFDVTEDEIRFIWNHYF